MSLTPYNGILGTKNAAHLLRRATFGVTRSDIDRFAEMTPTEAVELLFRETLPDPELPVDDLTGEEWVISGTTGANNEESVLQGYIKRWMIGQALRSDGFEEDEAIAYNVREKMTFFLHTIFTTQAEKVNSSRALYFQNQLFRTFAFDLFSPDPDPDNDPETPAIRDWKNFKDLTVKLCIDNAMLIFLDGRTNVKGNPNENFARELLELYSIGRGLEGSFPPPSEEGDYFNFKEQDVQEAARVLSGFVVDDSFSIIDEETGIPRGISRGGDRATAHDNEPKEFSERFGNEIIEPDPELLDGSSATEESAVDEIAKLIDLIYDQEETSRHICRKLFRYYVYYDITEEVEQSIITEMASTFRDSGYKLSIVLRELFLSEVFYDGGLERSDDVSGGIIKSPLDLVIGTLRTFQHPVPEMSGSPLEFYEYTGSILRWLDDQGMNYYQPFEVAGYAAYHQFPAFNRNWISTNYLTTRYNFIRGIMRESMGEEDLGIRIDILEYMRQNFQEEGFDPRELVKSVSRYFLPQHVGLNFDSDTDDDSEITAERLNYFLFAFLYSPQLDPDPEDYWTFRWETGQESDVTEGQLFNLMNAMLQSPEYQLM